jgi:hypothetical protein
MSTRKQISCVNKRNYHNPHEKLINIGGVSGGERWKYSQAEAVTYTERGVYSFYMKISEFTLDVIVAIYMGHKYLKTQMDADGKDNLLSLPECLPFSEILNK